MFVRLDAGRGRVQMGATKDKLTFEKEVSDGWCILVPAGTWHDITNIGATPMQVYAIYAPAHHKPGKVQATAAAAEADKDDEPAAWSVQSKHAPDKHGILAESAVCAFLCLACSPAELLSKGAKSRSWPLRSNQSHRHLSAFGPKRTTINFRHHSFVR